MPNKKHVRTFSWMMIVLAFSLLMLSGCNLGADVTGITPTPVTPSATSRVCPPLAPGHLATLTLTKTFLVILFNENATEGRSVLEFADRSKTSSVLDFMNGVLPELMGPGDQNSMFRLGYRSYESARYNRFGSSISSAPASFPTPKPHATLTPIPTPDVASGTPGLVIVQHRTQYESALAVQRATATEMAFQDHCMYLAYATAAQGTVAAWTATIQSDNDDMATQAIGTDAEGTPSPTEPPFAPHVVYEGLGHATIDLQTYCALFDSCKLLIIDEMIDWRNVGLQSKIPANIRIDLHGVDIIVVMPNCKDLNQPSCTSVQGLWTAQFDHYGARSTTYLNGEKLEQQLVKLIRRPSP